MGYTDPPAARTRLVRVAVPQPNPDQLGLEEALREPPPIADVERDALAARAPTMTLQERFELFHDHNPAVYEKLRELAHEAVARGHRRIGIEMLWQVIRWNGGFPVNSASPIPLDNAFRSRYARLLLEQEDGIDGLFELRKLHAA